MPYPLNGNTYTIASVTANTFTLGADADTTAWPYTSGGTADEGASIFGTYYVGTTMTLTASSSLWNASHVGALWRLNEDGEGTGIANAPVGETVTIENGQSYTNEGNVYGVRNVTGLTTWEKITRVPAHISGTVRVYAEGNLATYFDADFMHPAYCVVEITGYTSATSVTAEIVRYQMPASVAASGSAFWEEGAWSAYRGYPRAVTIFEQRLWLGGSTSEPNVVWASQSGSQFEYFKDGAKDGDAIVYRMASGSSDVIRWLMAGRVLTAGTSMGEFAIAASSQNEALTPSNVRAVLQTGYGTSNAQPVRINQSILYPQRNGKLTNAARKMRLFGYDIQADAYRGDDVTVFSEHVTGDGIDRIAYQTEPDSIVWTKRTDGQLAAMTYEQAQEVAAWHRHTIAGTDCEVKSLAVIPGDDGDDVWLSVKRTVNGSVTRSIEIMHRPFRTDDTKADGIYVDSATVYSGASTSTISGLNHLEGETVVVVNNGAEETEKTVSGGRITLDAATTSAVIGLRYEAILETTDIEAGARAGTAHARIKRVSQVFLRLWKSLGGWVGGYQERSDGEMEERTAKPLLYRASDDPMDASPPLFTGLKQIDFDVGHGRESVVRITHSDPFPFFVSALVVDMETQG